MLDYIYDPRAADDVLDAAVFYETESPGLGVEFSIEVEATVRRAATNPLAFALDEELEGLRCIVAQRFPYKVYYRLEPDLLVVVAVAHHRRRPYFWKK